MLIGADKPTGVAGMDTAIVRYCVRVSTASILATRLVTSAIALSPQR